MNETIRTGLMMDDFPLSLTAVVERAERFSSGREVVARRPDGSILRSTVGACAERSRRLASSLARLGVGDGDRVATIAVEPARAPRALLRGAAHGRGHTHAQSPAAPR